MKYILPLILIILIVCDLNAQNIFKRMYGQFATQNTAIVKREQGKGYLLSFPKGIWGGVTSNVVIDTSGSIVNQFYFENYSGGNWKSSLQLFTHDDSSHVLTGCMTVHPNNGDVFRSYLMYLDTNCNFTQNYKMYKHHQSFKKLRVAQTGDYKYLFCGGMEDATYNPYCSFFMLDSSGNILWQKVSTTFRGYTRDVAVAPDGNFLLALNMLSPNQNYYDQATLVKMDTSGNILWSKYYGDTIKIIQGVVPNDDGSILTYGTTDFFDISGNYAKMYITKLDSLGNVIWSKKYGDNINFFTGIGDFCKVLKTASNKYIFGVNYYFPSLDNYNPFTLICKLDENGDVLYNNTFYTATFDNLIGTEDFGLLVACWSYPETNIFPPVYNQVSNLIIKTDSMLQSTGCYEQSLPVYYEPEFPTVFPVTITTFDSNFVSIDTTKWIQDTLGIASRNEDGCMASAISEQKGPANSHYKLIPNPTHTTVAIEPQVLAPAQPHQKITTITVYDSRGNIVLQRSYNGTGTAQIDVSRFVAGIYNVQISGSNYVFNEKLVVD